MNFTCPKCKRLDTYATYRKGGTCFCICGKAFRPRAGSQDEAKVECRAIVPPGQLPDDRGFKP